MDFEPLRGHLIELLPQVDDRYAGRAGPLRELGDPGQAGLAVVGVLQQGALHVDDEQGGVRHAVSLSRQDADYSAYSAYSALFPPPPGCCC
jgi:hypothetical protein